MAEKGSVDYHKRIDFRALDVFVDAVSSATKDELKQAVKTASEKSKDYSTYAYDRLIWKRLATLLRGELKGYKKNPKRPAHEKGFIIEDKSPKGCAYVHKQIKGFLEHARQGAIYECSVCHEQFVKGQKKNPKARYFLYDVLNDYSIAKVDGKSDFGTLAHAKERGVKDNGGAKVYWSVADIPPRTHKQYFGRNKHKELIYLISTHGLMTNPISKKKARKKNPEHEIRELILWAENSEKLSNQFTSIMKNLERKAKRGIYDPVLAAKLWKYWIDEAVKDYNKEILGGGYSLRQNVFTMDDRKKAAIEIEAQWREDVFFDVTHQPIIDKVFDNPSRRKKTKKKRAKKNPTKQYLGFKIKGKDVRYLVNRSGKYGFSLTKGDALIYDTKAKAHKAITAAARAVSPAWDIGVAPRGTDAHIIWNALNSGKV